MRSPITLIFRVHPPDGGPFLARLTAASFRDAETQVRASFPESDVQRVPAAYLRPEDREGLQDLTPRGEASPRVYRAPGVDAPRARSRPFSWERPEMADLPICTFRNLRRGRQSDTVEGFEYLWMKYVTGFDPRFHCAQGLLGNYDNRFGGRIVNTGRLTPVGTPLTLNQWPFEVLYLCGNSGIWKLNLHIACLHAPGESFSERTYNGYQVVMENARRLPIPPLRDGWHGLPKAFTTCRNYQFGVAFYGPEGSR